MSHFITLEIMRGNDSSVRLRKLKHPFTEQLFILKECNKSCPDAYSEYRDLFQNEFSYMKNLENTLAQTNHSALYSKYFPKYYKCDCFPSGVPYILMEYINGFTLEHLLSRNAPLMNDPCYHMTPSQLFHLMDQINEIQRILYTSGMLQLDLNPQNIIVQNQDYDIKMIDFTDVYYTSEIIRTRRKRSHKLIDNRIRDLSVERQLQITAADLFTRLFYSGKDNYSRFNPDKLPSFFIKYKELIDCLEQKDLIFHPTSCGDNLFYWNL